MSDIVATRKVCAQCPYWQKVETPYKENREHGFKDGTIRSSCRHPEGRLFVGVALSEGLSSIPREAVELALLGGSTISISMQPSPTFLLLEEGQGVPPNRNAIRASDRQSDYDSGL